MHKSTQLFFQFWLNHSAIEEENCWYLLIVSDRWFNFFYDYLHVKKKYTVRSFLSESLQSEGTHKQGVE